MTMARRRSKRKRTNRKKQGISLIGIAETAMLINVATQTLFNTNAWDFITEETAPTSAAITLRELLNPKAKWTQMKYNKGSEGAGFYIMNNVKANWMTGVGGMILIPLAFKMGKQISRPAISRTNRLLNKAGVGSTVKL